MELNTTPEYEEQIDSELAPMSQEQILMNENDILKGLLEASTAKDDPNYYRKLQIRRKGKLLFEFRVRPISEDESRTCWNNATKYAPAKKGEPKVAIDTDLGKYRSHVIYAATVNEDRAKVWDNKAALNKLNIFMGVDMIDKVLLAGEKSSVFDIINDISDGDGSLEEKAKNSSTPAEEQE